MTGASRPAESSARYPGWRIVAAFFLIEFFIFGFGLYGQGVYLTELRRLHGWPTSVISTASTLSLLLGSLFAAFTADLLRWLGPRRLILAGLIALTASTVLLSLAESPPQLYVAFFFMAIGWTGMGTVVAATIVGAWFEQRRGLALSLAFNGATCGGIILAPVLVLLVDAIGFSAAMLVATAVMVALLLPAIGILIRLPDRANTPAERGGQGASRVEPEANLSRWQLLRTAGFWTITAPFALALLAQVAFIVHQISILEPAIGRPLAGLAVSITTAMALVGRIGLGLVVDRIDPRIATTASLVSQAASLFAMTQSADPIVLFAACAVFGFSIGNLITLPPLIIQREFPPAAFSTVLGLSTAIGGVVNACGPALIGLLRDATGSYTAPLGLCIVLQIVSAAIVLWRPRGAASVGDLRQRDSD